MTDIEALRGLLKDYPLPGSVEQLAVLACLERIEAQLGSAGEWITKEMFLGLLSLRVEQIGSQKAAAIAWGISESYLSDVLTGRRQPGSAICAAMHVERVEMYRRV